jgi:hypothetical protein
VTTPCETCTAVGDVAELRCELAERTAERDEARSNYQWMVDHAADQRLDGYRELGARAAAAENERDKALALAGRLRRELIEAREAASSSRSAELQRRLGAELERGNHWSARARTAEYERDGLLGECGVLRAALEATHAECAGLRQALGVAQRELATRGVP